MKGVFISAGESSGELYGAYLAQALRRLDNELRIYGMGGERMRSEGIDLIGGVTGAFGLAEVFSSIRTLRRTFKRISRFLEERRPEVVVLIDFPDFNLKVAAKAKSLGLKVLYYVSPQVWAWRKGRVHKISALTDRIAVVLPFEERIYKEIGADCEFVGHPIMEELYRAKDSREFIKESIGLSPERSTLALLPGSRRQELKRMMPLFLDLVRRFRERYPVYQYVLPLAPNIDMDEFSSLAGDLRDCDVTILQGRATEALSASDVGLIASGTATLQAALIGVPMVVVYKVFPLTYLIGRLIVNVRHISLVNLLSGEGVVKELMQREATVENIMKELDLLILDEQRKRYMMNAFKGIRSVYEGKNASERVAGMVMELAGRSPVQRESQGGMG